MVDLQVLEKFGSSNARLRELFEVRTMTAPAGDPPTEKPADDASASTKAKWTKWERFWQWQKDCKRIEQMEREIRGRSEEGLRFSMANSRLYQAVDLAWDTPGISGETIPLLLYAQRKIDMQSCVTDLTRLSCANEFLVKNDQGQVTGLNLPKFVDVSINLVRSYTMRRHAAQANKFNNLFPYLKYESRSTTQVGKLRADVMSQESEVVVDQFDWKHHDEQCMRDALLYGHVVDFVRCDWQIEKQWQFASTAPEFQAAKLKDREVRAVIVKEGLSFVSPHPTRLITDNSEGICSVNTDGGAEFIGHWDVTRYAAIRNNTAYFNRECITYGTQSWDVFANNRAYFNQYYSQLKVPSMDQVSGWLSASGTPENDRKNLIGTWSPEMEDMAMIKTEYFRKLVPKDIGCGDYPFPVWVRFVVAGDARIIYAQFLPSTPAAVLSVNEKDDRQINPSFAMDLMWAQDMMSNLVTSLILSIQQELFKVFAVNTDVMSSEDFKVIKAKLTGRNWSTEPLVVPFSLKNLTEDLGLKLDAVFKISETRGGQNMQMVFQAMTQLLSLVDRMTSMSPAENGQPAPREISATEVAEISNTTTSVYSFISDDIDEFRAAKKRILYDAMMVCRQRPVTSPVLGRYTPKTVQAAGFTMLEAEGQAPDDAQRQTVMGGKQLLVHDYVFSTRDGAERSVNTQAANTLVQLLQVALQVPAVASRLGKEKVYDMFNEVFRLSGAGVDLNLEMADGEEEDFGSDQMQQLIQTVEQLKQLMGQMADATQQNAEGLASQEEVNRRQQAMLQGVNEMATLLKATAAKTMNMEARIDKIDGSPIPEIDYKDAPPDVRRQIEMKNGFAPSQIGDNGEANDLVKLEAEKQRQEIELSGKAAATTQKIQHREAEHRQKMRLKETTRTI